MQPLTPAELKTMGGQPVWVIPPALPKLSNKMFCCLVQTNKGRVVDEDGIVNFVDDLIDDGYTFYPSPPTVWQEVKPGTLPQNGQFVWIMRMDSRDPKPAQFMSGDFIMYGHARQRNVTHWCDRHVTPPEPPAVERNLTVCNKCGGKGVERYSDAAGSRDYRQCSKCHGAGNVIE